MAVSGTVPARGSKGRIDPTVAARWVRRATLLAAVLFVAWSAATFGTQWVPKGMDTVPGIAPGSWCLIDCRRSAATIGRDVFVVSPDGVTLLSRVAAADDDTVTVTNPNDSAAFPDSRVFGPLPRRSVRGTVVFALQPEDATSSELPRAR